MLAGDCHAQTILQLLRADKQVRDSILERLSVWHFVFIGTLSSRQDREAAVLKADRVNLIEALVH